MSNTRLTCVVTITSHTIWSPALWYDAASKPVTAGAVAATTADTSVIKMLCGVSQRPYVYIFLSTKTSARICVN